MLQGQEPFPCLHSLNVGLVLELYKSRGTWVTWPMYTQWIEKMHIDSGSLSVNALRKSVLALESQSEKLKNSVDRAGT